MFGVVAVNGLAVLIRDNRWAFHTALATALAGLMLVGASVAGLLTGRLSGFSFMVLVGLGLYLPYVAVHTTVFERMIALTRDRGNLGYLMYLADAFGYLGYVAVLLAIKAFSIKVGFLHFFTTACLVAAGAGSVLLVLCWVCFGTLKPAAAPQAGPPAEHCELANQPGTA